MFPTFPTIHSQAKFFTLVVSKPLSPRPTESSPKALDTKNFIKIAIKTSLREARKTVLENPGKESRLAREQKENPIISRRRPITDRVGPDNRRARKN